MRLSRKPIDISQGSSCVRLNKCITKKTQSSPATLTHADSLCNPKGHTMMRISARPCRSRKNTTVLMARRIALARVKEMLGSSTPMMSWWTSKLSQKNSRSCAKRRNWSWLQAMFLQSPLVIWQWNTLRYAPTLCIGFAMRTINT